MRNIRIEDIGVDPFTLFAHPAVALVEADGKKNALTLSWGALGTLWNKRCVFVFIRDSRYSHELFARCDGYAVCFLDKAHADRSQLFGSTSGRYVDKVAASGLTVLEEKGIPYFAESELVIVGKKLIGVDLPSQEMLDQTAKSKYYPEGGYHTLYPAEIISVLKQ